MRPVDGPSPHRPQTVLVVEDEPGVRLVATLTLRGVGYTTLEAADGDAATRVADAHPGPIHLLVTDVSLPGTNGPVLAERLRRRRPEMRVLFVSGFTDDKVVRDGVRENTIHFLQKPFGVLDLERKVRAVLNAAA